MTRGEIWWCGLGQPHGSVPGFRRPAIIISANLFNRTAIQTVIVALATTAEARAHDPGNVRMPARKTGLRQDSILNVTQIATVDRRLLTERVGRVPDDLMAKIDDGLRLVLAL